MDKLLRCPFCGCYPKLIIRGFGAEAEEYDVGCGTPNCYLETGADWLFETKEEAIKLWNNRPYKVLEIL